MQDASAQSSTWKQISEIIPQLIYYALQSQNFMSESSDRDVYLRFSLLFTQKLLRSVRKSFFTSIVTVSCRDWRIRLAIIFNTTAQQKTEHRWHLCQSWQSSCTFIHMLTISLRRNYNKCSNVKLQRKNTGNAPELTRSSAVAVIADRTAYRAYGAPYEYR